MIRRPPEHRADADMLFIPELDDAWDHDRIAKARKATSKGDQCAVDRYFEGLTRFDLDAPHTVGGETHRARDFLRPDAVPTVFKLRRVKGNERMRAAVAFGDADRSPDALWRLCKLGVVEVAEGLDDPKPWPLDGALQLTDDDVQTIYDAAQGLVHLLGLAVYRASAPLSEDEGKP